MKIRILFLLPLLLALNAFAMDQEKGMVDTIVSDLLYEKIGDDKLVFDIEYDSGEQLRRLSHSCGERLDNGSIVSLDEFANKFRVKIACMSGNYEEISGTYYPFVEMPITTRQVRAGQIITSSDLDTKRVRARNLKNNFVFSEDKVIGMQARRNLASGSFIKLSDLAAAYVIKTNDPVNLVYHSRMIELKTNGIAMASGAIGDMIRVKNEDTGTLLLGQIINKNTVQVGGSNE